MKKTVWSVLTIAVIVLALVASACGGGKTTTSKPPTTTTPPPTTSTTPPPSTTTTTPPPSTTTGGGTLPTVAIAITTHTAAQLTAYKGLCQMCHGPGTTNSNPYPPSWDGKANGSTANTGVYTIAAGSTQDHSQYTVDQCTQAGCHAAPGGTTTTTTPTTPPSSTTTTPPKSTTTPPTGSTTPTSTVKSGLAFADINVDGFNPLTMTAKVGTSVTFTNNLESSVTLTCDALEVDKTILRGGQFTYTFSSAGSYTFTTDEGQTFKITVVT